jgi:GT2 family glycosyltransferase/peptidoglycan/xylan/chitin deacetylase (PgdA/CDA1 family)
VRIAVVVATYNRREPLRRLLQSLVQQELPAGEMEVIVVVDGSTDGTMEMLADLDVPFRLEVVFQENEGQAAARNAGWKAASAPVVLFLDDDLECSPGLMAAHLERHEEPPRGVVIGRVRVEAGGPPSTAFDIVRHQMLQWEERVAGAGGLRWPEDAYVATNTSVARELLVTTGGFDPQFYRALEDHDLGVRLWTAGSPFVFAPEAEVVQRYDKTTLQAIRDEAWYGAAEARLSSKHPDLIHHTLAAKVDTLAAWRRSALRLLAHFPWLAELLLGIPARFADRIPGRAGARGLAGRFASTWMHVTRLRATVDSVGGWENFDRRFTGSISVLCYHHVGPRKAGTYPDLTVDPATFERQIAALALEGYRALTPTEYLDVRRGEIPAPQKGVVITFDDAYEEIHQYALPVLDRFGFGSCVYVVTGELAGTNSWDEARGSSTLRLLDQDQIAHWHTRGVEFGGHSRSHPSLPTLDSEGLQGEIAGCAEDLERVTGARPRTFAYPYGEFDVRAVDQGRASFELAFTTIEGLNHPGTDPHLLRRTMVLPTDSGADVLVRARLGFHPRDVWLRWRSRVIQPVRRALEALSGRT